MKTQILLLFGLLFFLACDNEESEFSTCEDNPIENVAWIKELIEAENLIEDTNGLEITQYNFDGNTVFCVDRCINNCSDSLINVYDCEQNLICELGGIAGLNTCPNFETEAINQGIVFTNRVQESCDKKVVVSNDVYNALESSLIQNVDIVGNLSLIHI